MQGPLQTTPTALINWGKKTLVPIGCKPLEIWKMAAKCSYGTSLALVFGVDIECETDECLPDDLPQVLLRAVIHWGLGAVQFQATIDLRRGTMLFIPAENVWVDAYAVIVPPLDRALSDLECPPPFLVSVGVAYGCAPRWDAARLTEPVLLAADGARQRIRIPRFASGFSLVPTNSSTMRARVLTGGSLNVPTYEASGPITSTQVFPIVEGARCIEIEAVGGPLTGYVLFRLDL